MKTFQLLGMLVIGFCIYSQETIDLSPIQIQQIVDAHNVERKLLNEQDLIWNEEIASFAEEWATYLAQKDKGLVHRKPNKYGENISYFFDEDMGVGVALWNEEKINYIYEEIDQSNWQVYGHYSQVIWKNTTEVGCGCAKSKDGAVYLVCNYNPPGNFIGEKPY